MNATVGIASVVGVVVVLLALEKWRRHNHRKLVREETARRDELWRKIEARRIERAAWWRAEQLRRLEEAEDRAKVSAMERQRLAQAGDVVDHLATAMEPGASLRQRNLDLFTRLHPAWGVSMTRPASVVGKSPDFPATEIANEYERNIRALEKLVHEKQSNSDIWKIISTTQDESPLKKLAPEGCGGSFDGGGASGDYSSSSSSSSSSSDTSSSSSDSSSSSSSGDY